MQASLAASLADALDTGKLKVPVAPARTAWTLPPRLPAHGLQAWVDDFLVVQYPGYQLTECWPAHLDRGHEKWLREIPCSR